MTVLTVALYALVAVLGVIGAFRHLAWFYALLAAAGLVGLAFWVAMRGTQVEPFDGLRFTDVPALVGLAVAAAGAFGLPDALARWFPFGFRSREWEYDRALMQVLDRYNAVLAQHPGVGDDHGFARWERHYLDVGGNDDPKASLDAASDRRVGSPHRGLRRALRKEPRGPSATRGRSRGDLDARRGVARAAEPPS